MKLMKWKVAKNKLTIKSQIKNVFDIILVILIDGNEW